MTRVRILTGAAIGLALCLALSSCGEDRYVVATPAKTPGFTAATLNILHGIFCPPNTDGCRRQDRIELLFQWIAASGCPDVVTLQEVSIQAVDGINSRLASTCPFAYQQVFMPRNNIDDHMILTRYPAANVESQLLYGGFRYVLSTRIDHPLGPIDVFTTHLASGSDGANTPCDTNCPADCIAAGAQTVRECQAVQLANLVTSRRDEAAPVLITGDFNFRPDTFAYRYLIEHGWTDVYLAAGNPECEPATGAGCTSGREDQNLTDMESPEINETERIDYIYLVPPRAGSSCRPAIDSSTDGDGDGATTGIFDPVANPFDGACGPSPAPICWPSDHRGVQLDLDCS